jgi:hypothetical protein
MGRERDGGVTNSFAEGSPHAALPAVGGAAPLVRLRLAKQRAAPVVLR